LIYKYYCKSPAKGLKSEQSLNRPFFKKMKDGFKFTKSTYHITIIPDQNSLTTALNFSGDREFVGISGNLISGKIFLEEKMAFYEICRTDHSTSPAMICL